MDLSEIRVLNHYLNRIKCDDHKEAVQELYSLFHDEVSFVTFRFTHNKLDSEDLSQDFWAKINTYAGKYHGGNAYLYLRKCLNYFCLDWARKHNNRPKTISLNLMEQFESQVDENATIDQIALEEVFSEAKKGMSERERVVLTLIVHEEKTVREIAKELNISKSEAGRIRKSALDKLKTTLYEIGWDNDE